VDLSAIPPFDSDPPRKPEPQSKISKDLHELKGLTVPYGSRDAARGAYLLRHSSNAALAELREILYTTESRPALTFIGDRLGKVLGPKHVALAVDLLRLKNLASTDGFLRSLVRHEQIAVSRGFPSVLASEEMSPLRAELAKFCVSPDLFVSRSAWAGHHDEIQRLSFFPIVLLRQTACAQAATILVTGATRDGLDPLMNRRALEALNYFEERSCPHRGIPAKAVAAIVDTMGSLLRDPLNRMDVYAFVDRWLSKPSAHGGTDPTPVREALHQQWREYSKEPIDPVDERGGNAMDVISLLRHFDDPTSQLVREQACHHTNVGVSTLARLSILGGTTCVLSSLLDSIRPTTPLAQRLSALRVFGYSVSNEIDEHLLSLYRQAVFSAFGASDTSPETSDIHLERRVLYSVLARRIYTGPLDAPFTSGIVQDAMSKNVAGASLFASTLLSIAREGRVMPLRFYDDPPSLTPIGVAIELLRFQAKTDDTGMSRIADEIEGHFILDGPARFGFELSRKSG